MANDGFVNEVELIEYINNKSFNELNNNIQNFLSFLYGDLINNKSFFKARKPNMGQIKPDIIIECNGIKKFVSVKKGGGNSVHQEKFNDFISFLTTNGVSSNTISNLKLFHYGDGTTDDSGSTRYSASECEKIYSKEIKEINDELNKPDILKKILDRVLFVGNLTSTVVADVIYHGTIDKGYFASREEITTYFLNNKFESKSVHFGSLTYQVWGRNNNFTAVHPDRRYVMQIKWGQILNDINSIKAKRGAKNV